MQKHIVKTQKHTIKTAKQVVKTPKYTAKTKNNVTIKNTFNAKAYCPATKTDSQGTEKYC